MAEQNEKNFLCRYKLKSETVKIMRFYTAYF